MNKSTLKSQKKINLKHFKTKPCANKMKHNTILCKYYHSDNEKRRPYLKYQYSKDLCKNKKCKKEDC